jgi:hypothetical protein
MRAEQAGTRGIQVNVVTDGFQVAMVAAINRERFGAAAEQMAGTNVCGDR